VLGRLVHVASQDFTVLGRLHPVRCTPTRSRTMPPTMALRTGTPFVCINDSGGARVQEGIDSLSGYGKVFYANVLLSGCGARRSRSSAGPCAGGAAYSPALTDFIIQTRKAQMFITGPTSSSRSPVRRSPEDLGGAGRPHGRSGVDPLRRRDDEQAGLIAKKLLSFLPQNNTEDPRVEVETRRQGRRRDAATP
jgi:methylmalonyl-CoA carboxyltransferase large subunit